MYLFIFDFQNIIFYILERERERERDMHIFLDPKDKIIKS